MTPCKFHLLVLQVSLGLTLVSSLRCPFHLRSPSQFCPAQKQLVYSPTVDAAALVDWGCCMLVWRDKYQGSLSQVTAAARFGFYTVDFRLPCHPKKEQRSQEESAATEAMGGLQYLNKNWTGRWRGLERKTTDHCCPPKTLLVDKRQEHWSYCPMDRMANLQIVNCFNMLWKRRL